MHFVTKTANTLTVQREMQLSKRQVSSSGTDHIIKCQK